MSFSLSCFIQFTDKEIKLANHKKNFLPQVIAMLFGVAVPLVWCHTFRFASNLNQAIDLIIKSDCDNGKNIGVNTTGPGGFNLSARMLKTEIFVKFFLVLQR